MQEEKVCKEMAKALADFISDAFKEYTKFNRQRPEQIIVFRSGVGGPTA